MLQGVTLIRTPEYLHLPSRFLDPDGCMNQQCHSLSSQGTRLDPWRVWTWRRKILPGTVCPGRCSCCRMPRTWSPKPLILHRQYQVLHFSCSLEVATHGEGEAIQTKQAAVWGERFEWWHILEHFFSVFVQWKLISVALWISWPLTDSHVEILWSNVNISRFKN